jgi:hypothetical protein
LLAAAVARWRVVVQGQAGLVPVAPVTRVTGKHLVTWVTTGKLVTSAVRVTLVTATALGMAVMLMRTLIWRTQMLVLAATAVTTVTAEAQTAAAAAAAAMQASLRT